jgi:hypothetical protein
MYSFAKGNESVIWTFWGWLLAFGWSTEGIDFSEGPNISSGFAQTKELIGIQLGNATSVKVEYGNNSSIASQIPPFPIYSDPNIRNAQCALMPVLGKEK